MQAPLTDWIILLSRALLNGAVLSLVLTALMTVSGMVALDMWVGDYPPDIRIKFGPMSERARRARPFFAVAFFALALGIPLWGLYSLQPELGSISFLPAAVFAGLSVLVFNIYDLLILDWLFFCTLQPGSMVLPGTEGMPGYRDYWFHFVGFLKGLGFVTAGGFTIAAMWMLLQWLHL